MGWIAENLQKQKENIGFLFFEVPGAGAVTRKSSLGRFLGDLGAPIGDLRAIL